MALKCCMRSNRRVQAVCNRLAALEVAVQGLREYAAGIQLLQWVMTVLMGNGTGCLGRLWHCAQAVGGA
eukprot:1142566-Pelagomonas_calceolata.AAC.2